MIRLDRLVWSEFRPKDSHSYYESSGGNFMIHRFTIEGVECYQSAALDHDGAIMEVAENYHLCLADAMEWCIGSIWYKEGYR